MTGVSGEAKLSHLDEAGRARMVDVSAKAPTQRSATAAGRVTMAAETVALIREGGVEKGDVLTVGRLAGIMGAKKTAELIPLCHPLPLDQVTVDLTLEDAAVAIVATARTTGRTGVEMEALTAVSVAALAVYDMVKAVDRGARITDIRLLHKEGGKSGEWRAPDAAR
ncbi:MAG: cyclic pyranopterin monophosphate synthase MoaC [Alphaproteobacteria bacterium]